MQVGPVTLIGRHVRLEPLSPSHYERLVAIGAQQGIFRWFPYEIEAAENLTLYLHGCQAAMQAGTLIAFATIEQATDSPIGATCFLNIDSAHRRLEIGGQGWSRRHRGRKAGRWRASRTESRGRTPAGIEAGEPRPARRRGRSRDASVGAGDASGGQRGTLSLSGLSLPGASGPWTRHRGGEWRGDRRR